jgi:hypothetical protein
MEKSKHVAEIPFTTFAAIALRDGCDVLDVIGRRLRA